MFTSIARVIAIIVVVALLVVCLAVSGITLLMTTTLFQTLCVLAMATALLAPFYGFFHRKVK